MEPKPIRRDYEKSRYQRSGSGDWTERPDSSSEVEREWKERVAVRHYFLRQWWGREYYENR